MKEKELIVKSLKMELRLSPELNTHLFNFCLRHTNKVGNVESAGADALL